MEVSVGDIRLSKKPSGEPEQLTDYSRTNIFILDEELWNWAKFQSKNRHQTSVSEYIFQLIRNEKKTNNLEIELLVELEKYFELNHITLGDVANKTGLSIEYINDYLIERKIPIDNTQKAIFKIHYLLIENRITPREMCNLNRLSIALKFEQKFPSKRDLLSMFHEDRVERRNEIFSTAFDFLDPITDILENSKSQPKFTSFPKIPAYSKENMPIVLFELGINSEEETDLFDNPHYESLCGLNAEDYFLLAFDLAGWAVILKNISNIIIFQAKSLEEIFKILIGKIQELWQFILQSFNNRVQHQPQPIRNELLALLKH